MIKAQKPTVALEGPFVVHGTPWAQGTCGSMSTPRVSLGRGAEEDVLEGCSVLDVSYAMAFSVISEVVVVGLGVTVVRKRVNVVVMVLSSSELLILLG